MATENLNMNIENANEQSSQTEDSSSRSAGVRLTSEMLSKATVNVNMKFLSDIRNVIEVATQRGAWRSNELTTIGSLVDSLDNAFKQLASKSEESTSSPDQAGESTERSGSPLKTVETAKSSVNSTNL